MAGLGVRCSSVAWLIVCAQPTVPRLLVSVLSSCRVSTSVPSGWVAGLKPGNVAEARSEERRGGKRWGSRRSTSWDEKVRDVVVWRSWTTAPDDVGGRGTTVGGWS